jgi:hypothetical protein
MTTMTTTTDDGHSTTTVSMEAKLMQLRARRDDDDHNDDDDEDMKENDTDEVGHNDEDDEDDDEDENDEVIEVVEGRLSCTSEINEGRKYRDMVGTLGAFDDAMMPKSHVPTWGEILPRSMCRRNGTNKEDREELHG